MTGGRAAAALLAGIAALLVLLACACGGTATARPVASASQPPTRALAASPTSTATPPATSPATAAATATPTARPTPAGRARVVVLDPGHGGDEPGAAANGLVERDSNLDMARRVQAILIARGYDARLTREDGGRATGYPASSATGFSATRLDLQARVDFANQAGADLFVSIHSNGAADPGQRGVEVWYDPGREFGTKNAAVAQQLLANVLASLHAAGYPGGDRGLKDDTCFRAFGGRCYPLFVLGPARQWTRAEILRRGGDPAAVGFAPGQDAVSTRATGMPGALVELLFVTSPADAAVLQDVAARDAMATGIASAIDAYFAGQ